MVLHSTCIIGFHKTSKQFQLDLKSKNREYFYFVISDIITNVLTIYKFLLLLRLLKMTHFQGTETFYVNLI